MSQTRCRKCRAEHSDAHLCTKCLNDLEAIIGELPNLIHHLQVQLTRQDNSDTIAPRVYGAAAEHDDRSPLALISTPWPYSLNAASELDRVRKTMVTVVHDLCESRGLVAPVRGNVRPGEPRVTDVALAHWLLAHVEAIGQSDRAGHVAREFDRLHTRAARLVFGHEADVFLGRCDAMDVRADVIEGVITPRPGKCGTDLYAHDGDADVACTACGFVYAVEGRRAAMLESAPDHLAPVAEAASFMQAYLRNDRGEPVACTGSTIRNLAARGLITYRGTTPDGKQLVRVGDVEAVMRARIAKDEARRTRKVSA